jgi:hypothetical protein
LVSDMRRWGPDQPVITQFALVPKGGLIVAPHPLTRAKLIIDLVAQHQLPAIYPTPFLEEAIKKTAPLSFAGPMLQVQVYTDRAA